MYIKCASCFILRYNILYFGESDLWLSCEIYWQWSVLLPTKETHTAYFAFLLTLRILRVVVNKSLPSQIVEEFFLTARDSETEREIYVYNWKRKILYLTRFSPSKWNGRCWAIVDKCTDRQTHAVCNIGVREWRLFVVLWCCFFFYYCVCFCYYC